MPRRTLLLLLRFAVAFGLLAWLAHAFPVYPWLERPTVAVANALLHQRAMESRSLQLVQRDAQWLYVYDLRLGEKRSAIEKPMHAHGFILLIFASLALATPNLGWRRMALAFGIGAALAFGLCLLMLMSDVALWESETVAALGLQPPQVGPYWIPLGFVAGLHRTAAAGLLPVALWVLLLADRPVRRRASPRA
jgi:hypothetical protein